MEFTPEARQRNITTPPTGPHLWRSDDDIEAAVEQGSVDGLHLTLSCGHCCNAAHYLHEAVTRRSVRGLEFLLQRGDLGLDELCRGLRPVHLALQACVSEQDVGYRMLALLLRHGAQANRMEADTFGGARQEAPIHEAVRRGSVAALSLLLAHGADVHACDSAGNTPLHTLCQQSAPWSGRYTGGALAQLLNAGACPLQLNQAQRVPSYYAWDASLQLKLSAAESWYGRRALLLAQGRGCDGEGPAFSVLVSLPEIRETLLAFL